MMNLQQYEDLLAMPLAVVATAAFSLACSKAGVWLTTKTHNTRLATMALAASQIAGKISDNLAALPAGSNAATVKSALVQQGTQQLSATVGQTVADLGFGSPQIASLIEGELGKLNAMNPTLVQTVPSPAIIDPAITKKAT
jgi:hypothetical protein